MFVDLYDLARLRKIAVVVEAHAPVLTALLMATRMSAEKKPMPGPLDTIPLGHHASHGALASLTESPKLSRPDFQTLETSQRM